MLQFPDQPTLKDLQKYVNDMCVERGFDSNTTLEKFLLFTEEVGELAKAIRKASGMHVEGTIPVDHFFLEEEFADVAMYLMDLANGFDIDIETAIRKKEEVNATRTWNS